MTSRNITPPKIILLLGDIVCVFIGMLLGYFLRFGPTFTIDEYLTKYWWLIGITSAVYMFSYYVFEFYDFTVNIRKREGLLKLAFATLSAVLLVMIAYYAIPPKIRLGRGIFLYSSLLIFLLIYCWRYFIDPFTGQLQPVKNLLVAGIGATGQELYQVIVAQVPREYNIVGWLDDDPAWQGTAVLGKPVLGNYQQAYELASHYKVDLIVTAFSNPLNENTFKRLLECKMKGIEIIDMPSLYKTITYKVPILHIGDEWLLFGSKFDLTSSKAAQKIQRVMDLILSLLGLLLTAPLMALAALAIKMDSSGPVFYRQTRVGLNGVTYQLIKLRTMIDKAEEKTGAVWSQVYDTRVTRVGKILRRLRLDELPQLWNVLLGEMSFIGPRPERPEFVATLKEKIPYYEIRHIIKPGLTGWAQINYRYGSSEEDALEKLQYEIYYIQESSPFLNFIILIKTIQTVILKPGS